MGISKIKQSFYLKTVIYSNSFSVLQNLVIVNYKNHIIRKLQHDINDIVTTECGVI